MAQHMLTTIDNPFNPATHWDEWYQWDVNSGYNTSAFLARVIRTSDDLSEADQDLAIEDAIQEIVSEDALGVYIKVKVD